jgi:hypothetical protein
MVTAHDGDRQTSEIAHTHRLGKEIGDKAEPRHRGHHADQANQ